MSKKMYRVDISESDAAALHQMVLRGWSQGDLADYISADQANACLRVLSALGLDANCPDPLPGGHSHSQQHQEQAPQASPKAPSSCG